MSFPHSMPFQSRRLKKHPSSGETGNFFVEKKNLSVYSPDSQRSHNLVSQILQQVLPENNIRSLSFSLSYTNTHTDTLTSHAIFIINIVDTLFCFSLPLFLTLSVRANDGIRRKSGNTTTNIATKFAM